MPSTLDTVYLDEKDYGKTQSKENAVKCLVALEEKGIGSSIASQLRFYLR